MKAMLLLVAICTLLVGCAGEVESLVYANRGGWSPSSEFGFHKQIWDDYIRSERSGEKLGFHHEGKPGWKTFWHDRYQALRSHPSAESEAEISYIHQQRQRFGLPLYDPLLPPPA